MARSLPNRRHGEPASSEVPSAGRSAPPTAIHLASQEMVAPSQQAVVEAASVTQREAIAGLASLYTPDVTPHSSLEAAWRVGRLLNQLHYIMQVEWWMSQGLLVSTIKQTCEKLIVLSRYLANNINSRDRIQEGLENIRAWCNQSFTSLSHVELYQNAKREMQRESLNEDVSNQAYATGILNQFMWHVDSMLAEIQKNIEINIAIEETKWFRFGRHLDSLIRPIPAFSVVAPRAAIAHYSVSSELDSASPNAQATVSMWLSNPTSQRDDSSGMRVQPSQTQMTGSGLVQRDVFLADLVFMELDSHGKDLRGIENTFDFVYMIDELVQNKFREPMKLKKEDFVEVGSLGLCFDETTQSVRREGYSHTIQFDGRLPFNILRRLAKDRTEGTSVESLQREWKALGGDMDDPENGVISAQISVIRKVVSILSVVVPRQKYQRYLIVEASESTR